MDTSAISVYSRTEKDVPLLMGSFNIFKNSVADAARGKGVTLFSGDFDIASYANRNSETNLFFYKTMDKFVESFDTSASVSASYGFFSASASVKQHMDKSWSVDSVSLRVLSKMTTQTNKVNTLAGAITETIFNLMDPSFRSAMLAVNSPQSARSFLHNYGTHFITSVDMGGLLSLNYVLESSDESAGQSLETNIEAKYAGAATVEAKYSAVQSYVSTQSSIKQYSWVTLVGAGQSYLGGFMNGDFSKIGEWAGVAEKDTTDVASISSDGLVSMVDVAAAAHPAVQAIWQNAFASLAIEASLSQLFFFSLSQKTDQSDKTFQQLSPGGPHFKTVGGGFDIDPESHCWAYASFPISGGNGSIVGWQTSIHDCVEAHNSNCSATAYALCVYDPGDHLNIRFNSHSAPNTQSGDITVSVTPKDPSAIVVGGGFSFSKLDNPKYPYRSAPQLGPAGGAAGWDVLLRDYGDPQTSGEASAYVITIALANPSIDGVRLQGYVGTNDQNPTQEHSDTVTSVPSGFLITGGGFFNARGPQGDGNLCYYNTAFRQDSSEQYWEVKTKDFHASNSPSQLTGYSLGIGTTT